MSKITHDQKEAAIEAIKSEGTMYAGARAAGVNRRTLTNEMNRSEVFKRRLLQAREEGYRVVAEQAIEVIKSYAYGTNTDKTDRNRLTAAIALANAYEPGFRGTTQLQGRIEHNVRVITAVPRPQYQVDSKVRVIEARKKLIEEAIVGEAVNS